MLCNDDVKLEHSLKQFASWITDIYKNISRWLYWLVTYIIVNHKISMFIFFWELSNSIEYYLITFHHSVFPSSDSPVGLRIPSIFLSFFKVRESPVTFVPMHVLSLVLGVLLCEHLKANGNREAGCWPIILLTSFGFWHFAAKMVSKRWKQMF